MVLVPQICPDGPVLLENRQAKHKELYDRQGSKQLSQLRKGDSVRFRKTSDKHLSPAVVMGKHETPRSYMITDKTGREYRRNRRHIHFTQEPPVAINDDLSDQPEPLSMQSSVNLPSVTMECNVNSEPNPPRNNMLSSLHRSTLVRSVPKCNVKEW